MAGVCNENVAPMNANIVDVCQSPAKGLMEVAQSPAKALMEVCQSPAAADALSPRVGTPLRSPGVATPLRGRKRTASTASLPQANAAQKVPLIERLQQDEMDAKEPVLEVAGDKSGVDLSFDSLEVYKTETDSTTHIETSYDPDAAAGDSGGYYQDDCWNVAEDVEWQDPSSGVVMGYAACEDEDCEGQAEETQEGQFQTPCDTISGNLEWKDSATGVTMGYAVCNEELHSFEWKDSVTGSTLGYALCSEEDENAFLQEASPEEELCLEDVEEGEENEQLLRLTVEWEDSSTGAVMGYALCDEADDGLQEAQMMFGDTEDLTLEDEATGCEDGAELSEDSETVESETDDSQRPVSSKAFGYAHFASMSQASSDSPSPAEDDDSSYSAEEIIWEEVEEDEYGGADPCEPQLGFERQDEVTGAWLAYEVCDDSIEEEAMELGLTCIDEQAELQEGEEQAMPLQVTVEWKDPATGVMLGYELCDQDDVDDDGDDTEDKEDKNECERCSTDSAEGNMPCEASEDAKHHGDESHNA